MFLLHLAYLNISNFNYESQKCKPFMIHSQNTTIYDVVKKV